MFQNKILENLELKIAQTKTENLEKFEKIENDFKKDYNHFLENIFKNDNSGTKRLISAYFQLEKIDNFDKNNNEIFLNSVKKGLENIFLTKEKKDILYLKISKLLENKNFFEEKINKISDISKDPNYPILESLELKGILDKTDLINISLNYKEKRNFLDSLNILGNDKIEIIKNHFFDLNNTKTEDRINNFKSDFKEDIDNSKILPVYPKIISLVGKNYFKLKLKNKIETKAEALRRIFKILFLKLYRLKYSGLDINDILRKIESLDDLDSMLSLLIKFFEQLKQNPNLQKDYIVSDEIEETENLVNEAEDNKQKSIFTENKIIKVTKVLEETEKKLTQNDLEKILSDEVDLVGGNFLERNSKVVNAGLHSLQNNIEKNEEKDELEEDDLLEIFEKLKEELFEIEEEKRKMFLEGNYEQIDILNDKLIEILKKIEKLKKLLGIADSDEQSEEEKTNF